MISELCSIYLIIYIVGSGRIVYYFQIKLKQILANLNDNKLFFPINHYNNQAMKYKYYK